MTPDAKWKAVAEDDKRYDGVFFYAIKTTGIFCRPSCKSKMPLRRNVLFFESAAQAQAQGFRPCKRCRPDLAEYQPEKELAESARRLVDRFFAEKSVLSRELGQLGVTQHRMVEIFKGRYGMTLAEYINANRLQSAKARLTGSNEGVPDIAFSVGFESVSAFYRFFRKYTGTSPAHYRNRYANQEETI